MTTLQELIEQACDETAGEVNFHNTYSGRGMYGAQCVGISGGQRDCMRVIAEVIKQSYAASVESDDIDKDVAVDTLLDFSQDNMGRDTIMYWPELPSIDSAEELSDLEG